MTGGDACRGSGGNVMLWPTGTREQFRDIAVVMGGELTCNCDDPDWECGCTAGSDYCSPANKRRECVVIKVRPSECCYEAAQHLLELDGGLALYQTFYYADPSDPCGCNPDWARNYR